MYNNKIIQAVSRPIVYPNIPMYPSLLFKSRYPITGIYIREILIKIIQITVWITLYLLYKHHCAKKPEPRDPSSCTWSHVKFTQSNHHSVWYQACNCKRRFVRISWQIVFFIFSAHRSKRLFILPQTGSYTAWYRSHPLSSDPHDFRLPQCRHPS